MILKCSPFELRQVDNLIRQSFIEPLREEQLKECSREVKQAVVAALEAYAAAFKPKKKETEEKQTEAVDAKNIAR